VLILCLQCDIAPDVIVKGDTPAQWQAYLNTTFAPWGADVGSTLYSRADLYLNESLVDPQRAYDTINADYGLSCAFKQIAVEAKQGGAYKSPIYLYVNNWPPATPIAVGSSYQIQWAYHMWDWQAVTRECRQLGEGLHGVSPAHSRCQCRPSLGHIALPAAADLLIACASLCLLVQKTGR